MEEPGGLQSMGSMGVGHDWATSLSLFTFMHWRRKWQPTPVFLPGESQGWGSLVAAIYGVTQSRTRLEWLSSSSSHSSISLCLTSTCLYTLIWAWKLPQNNRTRNEHLGGEVAKSSILFYRRYSSKRLLVQAKPKIAVNLQWFTISESQTAGIGIINDFTESSKVIIEKYLQALEIELDALYITAFHLERLRTKTQLVNFESILFSSLSMRSKLKNKNRSQQ